MSASMAATATSRTGITPKPCWVCRYGPHEPGDHTYCTEAEALAEFAKQPQGAPVWPVIDGYSLGGGT